LLLERVIFSFLKTFPFGNGVAVPGDLSGTCLNAPNIPEDSTDGERGQVVFQINSSPCEPEKSLVVAIEGFSCASATLAWKP